MRSKWRRFVQFSDTKGEWASHTSLFCFETILPLAEDANLVALPTRSFASARATIVKHLRRHIPEDQLGWYFKTVLSNMATASVRRIGPATYRVESAMVLETFFKKRWLFLWETKLFSGSSIFIIASTTSRAQIESFIDLLEMIKYVQFLSFPLHAYCADRGRGNNSFITIGRFRRYLIHIDISSRWNPNNVDMVMRRVSFQYFSIIVPCTN